MKKAIVLLSGGLDSTTTLYVALDAGYLCHCLIIDYGQRHKKEIAAAVKIAKGAGCAYKILRLSLPWQAGALVDKKAPLPARRLDAMTKGIPATYVPARNTMFISLAASWAESIGAEKIFIGANAVDFSGYPDCRPSYLALFNKLLREGTKAGVEGRPVRIEAPLVQKKKSEIIRLGARLGVPYELTWSCYSGGHAPCMKCDACVLRKKGFDEAGLADLVEIFSSYQGEGLFIGAKQIFIRFAGCNLDCSFCDTRKAPVMRGVTAGQVMSRVKDLEKKYGFHHSISITGGEPLLYAGFLRGLLPELKKAGHKVYLETNGTLVEGLKKIIKYVDIVAMDIKLPSSADIMPLWKEHAEFLRAAGRKAPFVKVVVTDETARQDVLFARDMVGRIDKKIVFVIQPASAVGKKEYMIGKDKVAIFRRLSEKKLKHVRVIPQVHKLLGIR